MAITMQQRSVASDQRTASGRSHNSTQSVYVEASTRRSDTDHQIGNRPVTGSAKENSMASTGAVDPRLSLSRFARAKAVPRNADPASAVVVAELLAKFEELLQTPTESRETTISVGPLQLDLLTRTVKREERKIDLRPREFCLLEYMMRHRGQVLTRAMLFSEVWNYKFNPLSNLVDVHMGRLRRKIDEPYQLPMIYNVRGQGFVLREPD